MSARGPQPQLPEVSRRQFLGCSARQAAGVAAGVIALGSSAAGATSEQIRVGVIGVRNRGKKLAGELAAIPQAHLAVLCDVDGGVLEAAGNQVEQLSGYRPRLESDYRRVFDRSDLDAVVIATPDHWHTPLALAAMDAGKDIYLETPTTANLAEGASLLAMATRTGRVVQCGVQERSGAAYADAINFLHQGRLGSVKLARAWVVHRRKPIPPKVDSATPDDFDYSTWLGHLPARPFNLNRSHFNWRWFWDYGGGELSHWGGHLLEVARWGLNAGWPERISAAGGKYAFQDATETPDTLLVQYAFADRTVQWEHRLWSGHAPEGRSSAVAFHGTRGVLVIDRGGWKVYDGEAAGGACSSADLDREHLLNFLSCVRTRQTPNCSLAGSLISTGWCHLGNIAYRVGREVRFDPQTGICRDDALATQLVSDSRATRHDLHS